MAKETKVGTPAKKDDTEQTSTKPVKAAVESAAPEPEAAKETPADESFLPAGMIKAKPEKAEKAGEKGSKKAVV